MKKISIILLIIISLTVFNINLTFADTQNDISPNEAVSIINEYEKAYMDRDLNKMIQYVDQNSKWFKTGFHDEFNAIFKAFTNIYLYHFQKRIVAYVADGVEVVQHTLYVAYNSSTKLNDLNEIVENYYLRKSEDKYKIVECVHLPGKDIELVDKGTKALLENNADEAISNFKEAINSNLENSVAHYRLGTLYSRVGKLQESLQELEKAVQLRPNVGFYRFYLSQVYWMLGMKDKAGEEMGEALALDPALNSFINAD